MLDIVGGGGEHSRNQYLVLRDVAALEDRPFVSVPWVGRLEQQSLRFGLEHDRQETRHRYVVMVWALVIAPAHVHAGALGGHVPQGVVEHLDVPRGESLELLQRAVAIHGVTTHGEIRGVDLQHNARADDRLVFDLQCGGECPEVLILRAVIVVRLKECDHTGRGRVHEGAGWARSPGRGVEVADVRLQRFPILDGHCRDAAGSPVLGGRTPFGELAQQARELDQVLARLARGVAGESRQAARDVGRIADLAHLAIADDIDADLDLPAHDLRYRFRDDCVVPRDLTRLLALAREEHVRHRLAAWQAADVGGEDAAGACAHDSSPCSLRSCPTPRRRAAGGSRSRPCRRASPVARRRGPVPGDAT